MANGKEVAAACRDSVLFRSLAMKGRRKTEGTEKGSEVFSRMEP